MQTVILDTTILLYGDVTTTHSDFEVWIPELVLDEVRSKMSRMRVEQLTKKESVKIKYVTKEEIDEAMALAEKTGDLPNLSKADLSVIGLAWQAKGMGVEVTIYSDDYSVQNVLKQSGFKIRSFTNDGITRVVKWVYKCQACGSTFKKPPENECPDCGTPGMIKKVKK
ncbi:MAG: NOB1 family endonuclease [Promethearchaeota archaeon]